MSIAHKATGDLVTATDYNAIADACNDRVPLVQTGNIQINTAGNSFDISTDPDIGGNLAVNIGQSRINFTADDGTSSSIQVTSELGTAQAIMNVHNTNGNYESIIITPEGLTVVDDENNVGLQTEEDYSANQVANDKAYASTKAVGLIIAAKFDAGIATLVNGQATVNSTLVKTISRQITLNYESTSGALGILAALGADIIDNTSFIIKSLNFDGTVNTADNSQVRYCVIGD